MKWQKRRPTEPTHQSNQGHLEKTVATITQPVGKGASNTNHGEVLLVQQLINKHRGSQTPIGEDGVVGPITIGAIEEVQRRVVKMSYPDGRADPAGQPILALSAPGAGPAPPPPPPPMRGTIQVSFSHRSKLPTGVTGLPGAADKTTNTRYESVVTVSGGGISGNFK